ncbi:fimbria/pilus outer membrane usher protein [Acinetobacter soli]|uniref:fimbria/pilus outer membrane usher protein n=1 Tax=Acinetobacter soli TaxID=487316 RepID=UPI000CE33C3A|nr:fimbria/pilus outer membrane usher protein [Acinetobacter soli]PPB86159.1 fimbrial protein [Acinetobacter soli]WEI11870.1 fimbrial biogenesis outer membrane usher protein [Acinetobacter soli]WEI15899.1 fimbrial biogenesis outer membrane usher protein [Acinetobacter soli]
MPKKRQESYKLLKRHIFYYLASGVITMTMPVFVHAEETAASAPVEAEFDSAFLIGDAKKVDISRFKYGNPVLPGEYNVDVYVNGQWFGKRRMVFKALDSTQQNAMTCFTGMNLLEYGVKQEILSKHTPVQKENNTCYKIEDWVENAFYEFDNSRLRVDISIPQVALQKNAQGYVDPSVWDRGINAGFLSYNGSAYKTFTNSNNRSETSNAFMGITAGLNLGGWQLRHNGQWQWQDTPAENQSKSSYEETSTYLQRAFPKYRGVLTLGDSFTNGEVFDSYGYRGIDFSSDDRMLPNSMLGYAPRIRGNAKTNAKVEVRQQGQLIYQTTVAPGNFEINDLYPTGFGGEIEVTVIEANGEIQKFAVPYASVVQMLRPGVNRYSLTIGQFRDSDIDINPWIVQGKYQQGINNYLTGYTGIQASENYTALLLGAAFATPIGAVAFDVTHSEADFEKQASQSGQSFRLSYSKLISPTNTNLTLAAYRYSTENFYKLRDALLIRDLEDKGINTYAAGRQRSEFQITLNQGLPEGWGNFYMVGSWVDYWNRSETTKQYQVGYSNNYHGLTYGLSAINRQVEYGSNTQSRDTQYLMTLSFPMNFKRNSVNVNITASEDSRTVGASGTVGDRFSYGASMSHQDYTNPSFNVNGRYRTNYATVGGSYSVADSYQQAMMSLSGSVVAHSEGVLFGPEQGQTMVLVHAPEAAGAKVSNTVGLSINKAGYAVVPYVTPYRLNDITLDPQEMSSKVELEETSQRIAPFAGAIAKVDFATKTGYAVYINTKTVDGNSLPFAAQVFNQKDEAVGIVAQGSMIYLRTPQAQDRLYVKWGDESNERCSVEYNVSNQLQNKQQSVVMTEAVCK